MADTIATADVPHGGHLSDWAVELLLKIKTGSKSLPESISLKPLCKEGYEVVCARFSDWTEIIFVRKNMGNREYEDVVYYNSSDSYPMDIRNESLYEHFIQKLQEIVNQI